MRVLPLLLPFALLACSGAEKPADDSAPERGADTDTDTEPRDTSPMDDTIELPASPLPLTVTLGGSASGTATFDTIVCSHPPNNQFQLTWADSSNAYTWNLRVFIREPFAGRGTYETTVQVQLLENFSGGRYYSGDASTADVSVEVEDFGVNGAYGTVSFGALTGSAGDATVTPQPVPFWCDVIDD